MQSSPVTPLTDAQKRKLYDVLKGKNALKPCSICGHNVVGPGDMLVALPVTDVNGVVVSGYPNLPMAMVGCANCGHAELFSLVVLDLIKNGKPDFGV